MLKNEIIVLSDKDGVPGAGHMGVIVRLETGVLSYFSKDGKAPGADRNVAEDHPNLASWIEARYREEPGMGDPSGGRRYEEALYCEVAPHLAQRALSFYRKNISNPYNLAWNNCSQFVGFGLVVSEVITPRSLENAGTIPNWVVIAVRHSPRYQRSIDINGSYGSLQ